MPINGSTAQIIEIVDNQVLFGQQVINRYWYRLDTSSTPDLPSLGNDFQVDVLIPLLQIQSSELEHIDLTIINHSNLANYYTDPVNLPGILTDPAVMPPFCAIGVRLNRSSRDMRNGQKRIAGLQENYQSDGFLESGILGTVATAVSGMDNVLTESIRNYYPVVVRDRPTKLDPDIDPYDTSTWRYTFVSGVVVKNAITTQNSRKY
jgi:hypothetical protein